MRALLGILLLVSPQAADTENCPIPKSKWNAGDGEKAWGLKVKTVKCNPSVSPTAYRVVFEFSKDLKGEELRQIRLAFPAPSSPNTGAPPAKSPPSDEKDRPVRIEIHFFDEDGVVIERCQSYSVEGEITGKMGDAFRVLLTFADRSASRNGQAPKISKVELRMPISDKP
jgi:hypothetical protein